jgi:TPR repeat protein
LLGGYFIGSIVKETVRNPTPEESEAQQLEIAAERGDIDAMHALGVRYATAAGVPQDLDRAVSLYRRAADAGHAGARCRLGAAYRTGCGVEEDMVEARRNFMLASDAGNAEAQFNLAVIMESELAEAGSDDEAAAAQRLLVFELYRKSAAGGFAPALFNLGTLHYHGCPLKDGSLAPPDHALAVRFWRQAVDAGDDRSAFNLAICYANGTHCSCSRQHQLRVVMSRCLSSGACSGDGVEKDPDESRKLLEIAATRGNGRARGLLQQIIQNEMELVYNQDEERKAGNNPTNKVP